MCNFYRENKQQFAGVIVLTFIFLLKLKFVVKLLIFTTIVQCKPLFLSSKSIK